MGLRGWRRRRGHLEEQRRRQAVDAALRQRTAGRHHGPYRPVDLAFQPERDLCADRGGARQGAGRRRGSARSGRWWRWGRRWWGWWGWWRGRRFWRRPEPSARPELHWHLA